MLANLGRAALISILVGLSSVSVHSKTLHEKVVLSYGKFGDEFFVIYDYLVKTSVEGFDFLTSRGITPWDVYWHYRQGEGESPAMIYLLPIHWRECAEDKCPLYLIEVRDGAWDVTGKHLVNWKQVDEYVFVLSFREQLRLRQHHLPSRSGLDYVEILDGLFGPSFNLMRPLSFKEISVGRHDVDGDSVDELFVYIEHSGFCGTIGCEGTIFQRQQNDWRVIGGFRSLFGSVDSVGDERGHLILKGTGKDGYRTLKSPTEIHRWDGTQYDWECLDNCGDRGG